MKGVYILIVLVAVALASGCVEKPTGAPAKTPVETPAATPAPGDDLFGTESDIAALDAMFNDSAMDISLTEI